MMQIGSKVLIKENAYKDSTDLRDQQARGKVGIIIASLEAEWGADWKDCWVVEVDDIQREFHLTTDEVEETEAG